jgi:hypothetical protein
VSLWIRSGHGILIATTKPQRIEWERIEAMNRLASAEPLRRPLRAPDFLAVLADHVLEPARIDEALARFRTEFGDTISTDWFPYVEFSTPRGVALAGAQEDNLRWIAALRHGTIPEVVGIPDEAGRRRLTALVLHRRGECAGARAAIAGLPDDEVIATIRRDCVR